MSWSFSLLGGYREFTFEKLVARKDALVGRRLAIRSWRSLAFVAAYLILGLFGLPGSTVLNLTAGLLFRFWLGLLLVVLASTLASSLAFLSFRYLFRNFVEAKVRRFFPRLEQELQQQGAYFIFAMRLFPVIPYSLTNLVLAVSPVRFRTYLWVTLVAMLPRYLLYVYGGTHLGDVRDPGRPPLSFLDRGPGRAGRDPLGLEVGGPQDQAPVRKEKGLTCGAAG